VANLLLLVEINSGAYLIYGGQISSWVAIFLQEEKKMKTFAPEQEETVLGEETELCKST
jgi:hypothetical protein